MCESSCSENSEEVASINGSSCPAGKSVPGSKHILSGITEYKGIEGSVDYIICQLSFGRVRNVCDIKWTSAGAVEEAMIKRPLSCIPSSKPVFGARAV